MQEKDNIQIELFPSGYLQVNCYLVYEEQGRHAFLVDPGGKNERCIKRIQEKELSLDYIILTHGHGDHIGGVPAYLEAFPNAKLLASKAEEALLKDPDQNCSRETVGKDLSLVADKYVEDLGKITVGNMELTFLHTPGHTPGGMCILMGDVLFSGDTLFCQSIGRTDFPGGSFPQIKASIETKLYVLPEETRVLPGHMAATTIGKEKRGNPFV